MLYFWVHRYGFLQKSLGGGGGKERKGSLSPPPPAVYLCVCTQLGKQDFSEWEELLRAFLLFQRRRRLLSHCAVFCLFQPRPPYLIPSGFLSPPSEETHYMRLREGKCIFGKTGRKELMYIQNFRTEVSVLFRLFHAEPVQNLHGWKEKISISPPPCRDRPPFLSKIASFSSPIICFPFEKVGFLSRK